MRWVIASVLILAAAGILLIALCDEDFCWDCTFSTGHHHCRGMERPASLYLKTLTSAQADYRSNDRDGNGGNDFWRDDIAGLYALKSGGQAIKLIELGLAAADAAPTTPITTYAVRGPKSGYWYKALLHADESKPSPHRFAACAYPDTPSSGKFVYVVDERNQIFRRSGTAPVNVFPTDDELRQSWAKFD